MDLIEARVEAAMFSKLANKKVFIVRHGDDESEFSLSTNTVDKAYTWYEHGCEKGEGFREQAKKEVVEKKRKRTADELIQELVDEDGKPKPKRNRQPRSKQPTELALVDGITTVEAASKLEDSCKVKIKGKVWVVSVKGSWAIQRSIMNQCDGGLILVIRGQGYYEYPKSMWNEFESIFKSSTYDNGKPYSQSILPKKFAKYFKITQK